MNTQSTNGDVVTPATALPADELEFVTTLPTGQWLLTRVEPPKRRSATIVLSSEAPSGFTTVIAVGPEFRADVRPGDRVTYAEGVNLPKELVAVASWAAKYRWVHENKFLGRLPRSLDERAMPQPKRPAPSSDAGDVEATVAFIAKARADLAAQGLGMDGKPLASEG